jgi:glycosyltransferase involved in cell wall biosynthesis
MYRTLRAQDSGIELVVAGSDHPRFPGYFAKTRSAFADLTGVTWQENVPEASLPTLFESARVVALPYSATTGASSAALRAAAHGRPVVAYALRDLQTLACDENMEIAFAEPGDRVDFQNQLLRLLNAPEECERVGRANVAAMQTHTLDATCQHYANLFFATAQRRAFQPERAGRYEFSSSN